jgi:electron transfer flavoprotein alpha subunit
MTDLDPDEYTDVWVFVEVHDGEVASVSWELLSEGRRLADAKDEDLVALVIGDGVETIAEEAIAHGADRALVADDPVFEPYRADPYGEQFRHLVETYKPDIALIGGTHTGRDFAGRVAVPTHAGLTADCTELDVDDEGLLLARRPTFGGDAMATIKCAEHRPQMATVRPGVFDADEPDFDRDGEIVETEVVRGRSKSETSTTGTIEKRLVPSLAIAERPQAVVVAVEQGEQIPDAVANFVVDLDVDHALARLAVDDAGTSRGDEDRGEGRQVLLAVDEDGGGVRVRDRATKFGQERLGQRRRGIGHLDRVLDVDGVADLGVDGLALGATVDDGDVGPAAGPDEVVGDGVADGDQGAVDGREEGVGIRLDRAEWFFECVSLALGEREEDVRVGTAIAHRTFSAYLPGSVTSISWAIWLVSGWAMITYPAQSSVSELDPQDGQTSSSGSTTRWHSRQTTRSLAMVTHWAAPRVSVAPPRASRVCRVRPVSR